MKIGHVFVLLVFALALLGCNYYQKINKIEYIKFQKNILKKEFHGKIKAKDSTILSFQTEGKINYFPFSKGDFLKKGQTIAKLDGIFYVIKKNEEQAKLHELIIKQNKHKSYYARLDSLHKQGAVSDNDWESGFYELEEIGQEIKIQKEKINYMNKEIGYNSIIAPFDGYISEKFVAKNAYAKIGAPVIEFISSDGFEVEFFVNQKDISQIKINDKISVSLLDKNYVGKILKISKTSTNTGGYLIKATIENPNQIIKEGMSVNIVYEFSKSQITIPLSCVFSENDENYIYKITKIENNFGKIKKTKISIGEILDNEIEILAGLSENDLVVLNYQDVAFENQKIKL